MAIPDYQSLMLPLLDFAADGREHPLREAQETLASRLGLSADERAELLPSGRQPVFDNRVAWAKTYLQQAGLLSSPRRGYFQITDRGRAVLADKPAKIDVKFLDCVFRSYPATDSAAKWATRSGANWTRHSAVIWATDSDPNWVTFS
jgi:restriction system protein